MGLPNAVSRKCDGLPTEVMSPEVFVLMVKLAGVLLLVLVEVVIVASVNLLP